MSHVGTKLGKSGTLNISFHIYFGSVSPRLSHLVKIWPTLDSNQISLLNVLQSRNKKAELTYCLLYLECGRSQQSGKCSNIVFTLYIVLVYQWRNRFANMRLKRTSMNKTKPLEAFEKSKQNFFHI